jgi:hypothetical protein
MVNDSVRGNFMNFNAFSPLGAKTTTFTVNARSNTRLRLDLTTYGIPENSLILAMNYTSIGAPLCPYNMHSNNPKQRSSDPPTMLNVFVAPWPDGAALSGAISIAVVWLPHTRDNVAWHNLVSAFDAYVAADFQQMIIPANVAVEVRLTRFLSNHLTSIASTRTVESFLNDAATYSHQLNLLLPLLLTGLKKPLMSHLLRGNLNRLRKLRNDIAHRGETETALSRPEAAELLCSAFFGFKFLLVLEEQLKLADSQVPTDQMSLD